MNKKNHDGNPLIIVSNRLPMVLSKTDLYWWVDEFLKAVFSHNLHTLRPLKDDIPSQNLLTMDEQ